MRKTFLAGLATGLLVAIVVGLAKDGLEHALSAGDEKVAANDLLSLATELSRFNTVHAGYPAVCDWPSLNRELGNVVKVSTGFERGLYYCSNGSSYLMLYRPLGVQANVDGFGGAYGMSDGKWVAWPTDLPKESRRTPQ